MKKKSRTTKKLRKAVAGLKPKLKTKKTSKPRAAAKNKLRTQLRKTTKPRKPKLQKRAAPKPKKTPAFVNELQNALPARTGKLATMPNRGPGVKADINVRFTTPEDYELVKKAAASVVVNGKPYSMNRFIVEAAIEKAKASDEQAAG